jgi:hypothetical protein
MVYGNDKGSYCRAYLNRKAKNSLIPYIKEKSKKTVISTLKGEYYLKTYLTCNISLTCNWDLDEAYNM